ncbi:MAG: hypothetical protein J6X84_03970 [Treponema sp.]|nr:hypothetical protein [Treponema sp.]
MKKLKFIFLSIFIVFSVISCEIGLGSSVDTDPPALEIISPAVDSVIRDSFAISGTYKDDGTIASVSAKLKRTDNNGDEIQLSGEFFEDDTYRGQGTWKILVTPFEFDESDSTKKNTKILDGTYQATVIIKDTIGRKTTQNTTFTIDNTPPILILSRPSTIFKEDEFGIDAYGQTFSIEGKAADDNNVSKIIVDVYDLINDENALTSISLENIPLSIEKNVAIYDKDDSENDYSKIYAGTENEKAAQRYCTITIYDNAKQYSLDGNIISDEGNSTDVYYMDSILSDELYNKYTTTDLYHIVNETQKVDIDVKQILSQNEVTKSKFSINPANNPKFIVTSSSILQDDKNLNMPEYYITAGNRRLEVEITPGLDGYAIDKDSVGIYLQECLSNGEETNAEPICIVGEGAENHITNDALAVDETKKYGVVTQSGKTYKFKTLKAIDKIDYYSGLDTEKYYKVVVVGKDTQGANIISDGIYAFKLVESGTKYNLSASCNQEYISTDELAWVTGEKYENQKVMVTLNLDGGEPPFSLYREIQEQEKKVAENLTSHTIIDYISYADLVSNVNANLSNVSVYYTVKNESGNVISTTASINLKYDSVKPEIKNIQFAGAYEKIDENDITTFYLNNENGKKYTISGIATDDNIFESAILEIPGKETKKYNSGSYKFTDVDFSGLLADANGGVTATLTVTDTAGNQTSKNLSVVFDNESPVAEHLIDSKGKDLVVRIGDFDNDDIDENHSLWTAAPQKNVDVGKKYAANSYGNANTIQLRGNFSDSLSGVSMIYYKVFASEPTANDIQTFAANYKSDKTKTGYFAPLAAPEEKLVFYNVQGGNDSHGGTPLAGSSDKYYKTITSNYKSSLSNFEEGKNYVVLVAEDNVGNVGVDTIAYSINVDTAVPEITPDSDELLYSNGKADIEIHGTITDKSGKIGVTGAGVDSENLKIRIANEEALIYATTQSANDINDENKLTWTATIPKERLNSLSGNVTIYAIAKDKAGNGNTTTPNIATIAIDKVAPTVKVNSPKDADTTTQGIQVNGIISLSGTVEEAKKLSESESNKLALYYTTNQTLGQKSAQEILESDIGENPGSSFKKIAQTENAYNWNFNNIDTSKLDGTNEIADGTEVYLTVCSKDFAGNAGFSAPLKLTIDQDTDRPIIRLSNVSLSYKGESNETLFMDSANPVWLNRSEISGVVNDDDDSIEYVKIIVKGAEEPAPLESEWAPDNLNVYQNGIWFYSFQNNGQKKLYFQVKDGNKIFTSNMASSTAATFGPKIIDANSNRFGYKAGEGIPARADDILYFKVDTDDPTLENPYYFASSEIVSNVNTISEWTQIASSIIAEQFGGTKHYLYIKYKATDTNGISAIDVKFAGTSPQVEPVQIASDGQSKECIAYFDISENGCGVESGLANLSINVKDNAAANTGAAGITKNYEMTIDNKAPEIGFSNYSSGTQVYGSSAVSLRGSTSDKNEVKKVEFALTKNQTKPDSDSSAWKVITYEDNVSKDSYTNALSWQIVFDGKTELPDESSYHAELLKKAVFDLYEVETPEQQAAFDELSKVYVWIRATDELGNQKTNGEDFYFDVIPNGDRPAIEITYPSDNSSVGGTIRISGITDIQDTSASVTDVYIQIDPHYNGTFNENWANVLEPMIGGTSYSIEDAPGIIGKGIKSQGTSKLSWYLAVNANKEFNGSENQQNCVLGIRAYAVSSTGKISESKTIRCPVDPDAPIFGQTNELRFVQYDENGNEIASRKYENGVYLKGQWYLVGSVEDDSGIRQLIFGKDYIVQNGNITAYGNGKVTEREAIGANYKNYDLKIPVGNSEPNHFGELKYEISATDGSDSQASNSLLFTTYYDNKAPVFEVSSGNGNAVADYTIIRQSNGAFTVSGTFTESSEGTKNQSGFKRIAMFFTRTRVISQTTTNVYVLDPMVDDGANGDSNFYKIGTKNGNSVSLDSGIVQVQGLFWRTAQATLSNGNQLLVTGSLPNNVRVGGLCMVDNVSYRIKAISGTTVTLEGTLTDFSSAKNVYFALAQIIDNPSQESGTTKVASGTDETTNSDGDFMVEGVQFLGGVYNWNASLDSSNMLDGIVNMCFVAYDAAGNYTEESFIQKISNNAPRIAGVSFGTDTDLSGTISDSEMETSYAEVFKDVVNIKENNKKYNGQDSNGNWIVSYNPYLETDKRLVIKGAMKVKPEIVGGNSGLGWSYIYKKSGSAELSSTVVTEFQGVGHSSDGSIRDSLSIDIELKDFLKNQVAEGNQEMQFVIWDKTDGAALGDSASGSANATIILPVTIVIADENAPTVELNPLYWESNASNSIYQNNKAYGHIELKNELPDLYFSESGSGVYDLDDKVSGKITFEGTATDNVVVNKIELAIAGYNSGATFTLAERGENGWTSENLNQLLIGESAKNWAVEILEDSYNENGENTVKFRFHFDTEKIAGFAKTDVAFEFKAYDKGSPTLSGNEVSYSSAKFNSKSYQVDVVPYITEVTTALSALKKNNPSVYARTALGHYAVASTEAEIKMSGFNLSGGTVKFTPATQTDTAEVDYDIAGFAIPATAKSGSVSIQVSGVDSLNNKNNNNGKGSFTGSVNLETTPTGDKTLYTTYYYNRQPNGDNNNLLTDDVVFDVWEINSKAAKPVNGAAKQPCMSINPINGQVGFAFVNGALLFSMGSQNYAYDYWLCGLDVWTSAGFTYDELGYSYGTAAGGDINADSADSFAVLTSRWGTGTLRNTDTGHNNGTNQMRLELIGQKAIDENGEAYGNIDKERIQSTSLATTVNGTNTNVYLAYYDNINNEIRFRWSTYTGTSKPGSKIQNLFVDAYGRDNALQGKVVANAPYTLAYKSLLAGQTPGYEVVATDGTAVYAGQYVSISAMKAKGDSDDAVVAVWYDSTNNQMLYSFNKTPKSVTENTFKQDDTGWSKPVTIFGAANGIGEYCKVATDETGGVHIAAYDSLNGDLWYAYLEAFDEPSSAKSCVVDTYGIIGTELNIDVGLNENNNPIPFISYYAGSCARPKIAYWNSPLSLKTISQDKISGVISDSFTEVWESSVIPTESKVSIDHINIGVWKSIEEETKGRIINSTEGVSKTEQTGSGFKSSVSRGKIYGNGSKNAILGYAITQGSAGYIETAQMK